MISKWNKEMLIHKREKMIIKEERTENKKNVQGRCKKNRLDPRKNV